jgi:hypothetical protein
MFLYVSVDREDTDPASVGVTVTLVMWTGPVAKESGIPSPCDRAAFGSCTRLVRVLTLLRGTQPGTLVTTFHPDTSVHQYLFVVRDAAGCTASRVMVPDVARNSMEYTSRVATAYQGVKYAGAKPSLFEHGRYVCDPVLHL